jgi:hypothetical protein
MIPRLLADLVMVAHGALLVFFVVGGFLAWRWSRLIWAHLFVVAWNLTIVLADFGCPLTVLEKSLRRQGGEEPYQGGFIRHYVEGTVYPTGYTWLAEIIGFALIVISYLGLALLHLSRRRKAAAANAAKAAKAGEAEKATLPESGV